MTHHTTHTGDPDLRLGYAQALPADGAVLGRETQITITIEQPMTPQEMVRRLLDPLGDVRHLVDRLDRGERLSSDEVDALERKLWRMRREDGRR